MNVVGEPKTATLQSFDTILCRREGTISTAAAPEVVHSYRTRQQNKKKIFGKLIGAMLLMKKMTIMTGGSNDGLAYKVPQALPCLFTPGKPQHLFNP